MRIARILNKTLAIGDEAQGLGFRSQGSRAVPLSPSQSRRSLGLGLDPSVPASKKPPPRLTGAWVLVERQGLKPATQMPLTKTSQDFLGLPRTC